MKPKIILFLAIFSLSLLYIYPITLKAQEPTFERVYGDYVFAFDQYRKARDEYELARANYLASKTLASKSEAEKATLKMLEARDEVVMTHLTALRKKITDTGGIPQADRDSAYSQIDVEINWYRDHKAGLANAGSLENLVKESKVAKERFKAKTEVVMFKTLSLVQIGKVDAFRGRAEKIVSEINSKLAEIRLNDDKNTQKVERWLLDTDARIERSKAKEEDAKESLNDIEREFVDREDKFGDFRTLIIESNQFLKEAVSFMREIVKDIKTAED